MPGPPSRRWWRSLALLALALVVSLVAGCASFPDSGPRDWREKPEDGGPLAAPPRIPEQAPEQGEPGRPPPAPPGGAAPSGCVDPDPQVVATCLEPVGALVVLPGGEAALVGERSTGRILRVQKDKPAELINTVPVDAAGGGLSGLVLSPSYGEDRLLYAYVATGGDHRVVRIAGGDPPTPVLTGIPRVAGGGALGVDKDGFLLVATAADGPAPAATSLAGKLLRVDTFGRPARDNPIPGSPVYASGLRSPGGVCTSVDNGTVWVTDRTPERDLLHRILPGPLGPPAWTWPDRPGVTGCAAPPGAVVVGERNASALYLLRSSGPGTFTGTPQTLLAGVYGRLGPTVLASDGLIWLGTVNKGGGGPVAGSDDRVIRIQPPSGGGGSGPE